MKINGIIMSRSSFAVLLIFMVVIRNIICGKLEKIVQHPSNILDDFFGYRDISIVHFNVPENVLNADFKFAAKEKKTSGLGNCPPRNVSIYLKFGSIPLVQPDGAEIAANLLKKRRKHYEFRLSSGSDQYSTRIATPASGDWYAIAFRSWSDPDAEKITQQGLGASCDTILDAELSVEKVDTHVVMDIAYEYTVLLNNVINSATMQFIVPDDLETANISLTSSCGDECEVSANIMTKEFLVGSMINKFDLSLPFRPYTDSRHYLTLLLVSGNSTNVSVALSYDHAPPNDIFIVNKIPLIRKSLPDFFLFDYEHFVENSTEPSPVNVTINGLTMLSFRVGAIYDVGGTVTIGLKLLNKTSDIVVVGCISLGYYASITAGGGCIRKNSTVNASDLWANDTKPTLIHIPYPEPGLWHLTLKAFRISSKCSCSDTCQTSGCATCSCMIETSTKVETHVASSPCIEGRCSSNGRCLHYMSGGFVFSACHCVGGYRGFDCADDTYVLTRGGILVRLLMLTLSNLAFVASIYVAYRREYYTETIVYTAVMFFSIFYHACEAGEDVMGVCITRLNVLQFCDFYNALLSIWVTLVAMASFGPRLTAFCQLSGAIALALGAEMDRTALWVFLLPAITGCILIGLSWGFRCRRQRNFSYPASRYKNFYLPLGLCLVFIGLICYAFFQTRRNYHIVHSFWHICVAIGVVLLLPKRKYMK